MANEAGRNFEFEEAINTDKKNYLSSFVDEFDGELEEMEQALAMESAKILLNWVRDKLHRLHGDFNADV